MYKQIRRTVIVAAGVACALFILGSGGKAHAQEAPSTPATSYDYVARPNDNLTLIVRRSLQLHSQAKNTPLSDPAIIYCETNAVQQLGSRRLVVGERVSVPFDILQKFMDQSKNLTATQAAAWQVYASRANFNLAGLEPTNKTAANQSATPSASPDSAETTESTASDEQSETPAETPENTALPWYFWVLGVGTILTIYYLLGGRVPARRR